MITNWVSSNDFTILGSSNLIISLAWLVLWLGPPSLHFNSGTWIKIGSHLNFASRDSTWHFPWSLRLIVWNLIHCFLSLVLVQATCWCWLLDLWHWVWYIGCWTESSRWISGCPSDWSCGVSYHDVSGCLHCCGCFHVRFHPVYSASYNSGRQW